MLLNNEMQESKIAPQIILNSVFETCSNSEAGSPAQMNEFNGLKIELSNHPALNELKIFGENLIKTPLNEKQLKIYFATMWAFFREIPTGILALALRVTDDWMNRDMWDATSKGAYILYADVDEFGLQAMHKKIYPSHHQLFSSLTNYLGVLPEDFTNKDYILSDGVNLGELTFQYYREESLAAGLGFHLASELTSSVEFTYFLDGFSKHREHYNLKSENDPVLTFFRVHTLVEPLHLKKSEEIINSYLNINPATLVEIKNGSIVFMNGFEQLFAALNQKLFNCVA